MGCLVASGLRSLGPCNGVHVVRSSRVSPRLIASRCARSSSWVRCSSAVRSGRSICCVRRAERGLRARGSTRRVSDATLPEVPIFPRSAARKRPTWTRRPWTRSSAPCPIATRCSPPCRVFWGCASARLSRYGAHRRHHAPPATGERERDGDQRTASVRADEVARGACDPAPAAPAGCSRNAPRKGSRTGSPMRSSSRPLTAGRSATGTSPDGCGRPRSAPWAFALRDACPSPLRCEPHDPGGLAAKAVQSALGHGSAAFTLTVYGHLFDDDLDELATALDAVSRRTGAVQSVANPLCGDRCEIPADLRVIPVGRAGLEPATDGL